MSGALLDLRRVVASRGVKMPLILAAALLAGCAKNEAPATSVSSSPAIAASRPAVDSWIALVDAGKYADSWTAAAIYFKGVVDEATWEKSVSALRGPLGALKSRTLLSATPVASLPGAPDGEYVVFQFDASFANKASAVETITPMKERDGSWRVSGYYVR